MRLLDVNILVYAAIKSSPRHEVALRWLSEDVYLLRANVREVLWRFWH